TFAPTTAPPVASTTVPRILPPVLWPIANGANSNVSATTPANQHKRFSAFLPKSFMTSPLSSKFCICTTISRLLEPRKPYYNPANLWDDGQSVKQKEFIQGISAARPRAAPSYQRSRTPRRHFLFRSPCVGIARTRRAATHAQ